MKSQFLAALCWVMLSAALGGLLVLAALGLISVWMKMPVICALVSLAVFWITRKLVEIYQQALDESTEQIIDEICSAIDGPWRQSVSELRAHAFGRRKPDHELH